MSTRSPFGEVLESRLKSAGLSARDFCVAIGLPKTYGSHLLTGKRTLALERLADACRVLKLYDESPEKRDFEQSAYLSHAPAEVAALVRQLEDAVTQVRHERERLRTKLANATADLARARADLVTLEADNAQLRSLVTSRPLRVADGGDDRYPRHG